MNKELEAIEIFGNADQPSRSGSFISPETFIECLKNSAPVPVTVKGEIVGHIVMKDSTSSEVEKCTADSVDDSKSFYTKNDIIEEIEDIRKETRAHIKSFESAFGDIFSMLFLLRYIDADIDKRISKFKKE